MQSFDEGLERYRRDWFRIDQLYRQFTYAARPPSTRSPLEALREQVEKRYTNKFVYELGNAWQQQVDAGRASGARPCFARRPSFYADYVEPLVRDGDKKAVVIISDALRYEVADELGSRIRQEDRFDADARGRPRRAAELHPARAWPRCCRTRRSSTRPTARPVLADGQPTNGTAIRSKILESVGGTAIQAEDFKALSADERRELYKSNQVLYVYHNRIDATGDKPGTERQVFEAAEDTLRDLVDLVKKLANANATNIFITADHGFLFQDEALADTFFLSTQPQGDEITVINRRYVLGRGLKVDHAFTTFTSAQLGLDSDLEVQIPKSIHRLRLAGGWLTIRARRGALQEIVVPVLAVNKKRKSDTRLVNVEVLPGVRQDHHRPARRQAVPVRAGQRQGPAAHAPRRALRRRDADLEPARADLRPGVDRQARPLPERAHAAQPGRQRLQQPRGRVPARRAHPQHEPVARLRQGDVHAEALLRLGLRLLRRVQR